MFALYRLFSLAAAPFVRLILERRMKAGKEDPARLCERYGTAGAGRPEGPLAWIHAASVGESLSALPLIECLLSANPRLHVLVTTGTVTSAGLMERRLPHRALHQYAPVDLTPCVRRFLDHWRPDLGLWIESELWPNLMLETRRRGVPMVLVNARISPRSFDRWRCFPFLIRRLLSSFDLCLGQNREEAERLKALGALRVAAPGNLKYVAAPLPAPEEEFARLQSMTRGRALWLAASTHAGEEKIAGDVHLRLKAEFPGLLTIIVPRHATRGPAIAKILKAKGLSLARRAAGEAPGLETDIYLADTMGELGLFYRLAEVTFIGGSLVPHGGHNALEAGPFGCAVILGPHTVNFREITGDMLAAGAAVEVADGEALADTLRVLLADEARRQEVSANARRFAASKHGILDEIMERLAPYTAALDRGAREGERGAAKEDHRARA